MPWGKRRKGKHSGRGTSSSSLTPPPEQPSQDQQEKEEKNASKQKDSEPPATDPRPQIKKKETSQKEPKKGNKKPQEKAKAGKKKTSEQTQPSQESHSHEHSHQHPSNSSRNGGGGDAADLVLTSEKRRGVYECDYCHSDISQLPRIRCAVCADFDLCLDCFATTDHSSAIARLKAAATAHSELKADGIQCTMVAGISSAAANHDDTHGYRVCDSTRYPVFGSNRNVIIKRPQQQAASATATSVAASSEKGDDKNAEEESNKMDVNSQAGDDADEKTGKNKKKEETVEGDAEESLSAASKSNNVAATTATSSSSSSSLDNDKNVSTKANANNVVKNLKNNKNVTMEVSEDPKSLWTAEEDLRLLDAIKTHGLGNWADISEAVGGNGSVGKTPRRCMERYFDDFLGRYGHVLPPYTIAVVDSQENNNNNDTNDEELNNNDSSSDQQQQDLEQDESVRASKRRHALMMRTPSNLSASSGGGRSARKRFKVVPTESLAGYDRVWSDPYLPPIDGIGVGQEVARDLSTKNELAFVKAISSVATKEEADKIRKEWIDTRMNQVGAPTVLPPRPDDSEILPGAELAGFMPRRGDLDIEWENEAEAALADMEFTQGDSEQDKQLKLQVLDIYCQKQDEREKRKKFILSRNLYDYRKYVKDEEELTQDERDLMHRMRLFERFHTPKEHKQFIADIIKAKQLRKEIAKLQMYRRIGIRSLAEAEKYELDKKRRQYHKLAQFQKEVEAKSKAAAAATAASSTATETAASAAPVPKMDAKDSLWKQYRTSDRKVRRSINRTGSNLSEPEKLEDKLAADALKESATKKEGTVTEVEKKSERYNKENAESKKKAGAGTDDTIKERSEPSKVEDKDSKEDNDTEMKEAEEQKEEEASTGEKKPGEATIQDDDKMEVEEDDGFDIAAAKGYDLLSRKEAALCVRLKIFPSQYLEIKKALVHESLLNGLLDKEGPGSGRRMVVKIDVERRGNILDFMLRAGWISIRLAKAARNLAPVTAE